MSESNMKHNPCDYCIELECEHRGVVCPFYKEEKEADKDEKEDLK